MGQWPTRTTTSGAVVVVPEGRLNVAAAPALRTQLLTLVQGGQSRVVVDLSAAESIDSSGLGALISALKAARQAGGDLRIAAPSTRVVAALELTNLNRVLPPHPSADSAFDEPA
ncbi:STAS domain-containing protein [Mycobacterium sp. M26]|uniref:STAS domain-containing protein n=1 Tax=Mycobacterium sp. M26 TaxID=1762962 RepID=UPI00073E24ED|nr:STAS domain-containing protein [Mycobacterium sp. M26]